MPRAKRGVLAGFPIQKKFNTREELNEYLSQDTIQCLLCGRRFQILDTHLKNVHGVTSDDYREMYGIGYSVGLQSARKKQSAIYAMKKHLEENPHEKKLRLKYLEAARRDAPQVRNTKPDYWKNERTKYSVEAWYEMGRRHLDGRSLSDVSKDEDMPSYTQLKWAFKKYPRFAQWWQSDVEPNKVICRGWHLTKEGRAKRKEQNKTET